LPIFLLLEGDWVGDSDEIKNDLQDLSVVLHVILGLREFANFINLRFKIA
jgi:hypothetical protein